MVRKSSLYSSEYDLGAIPRRLIGGLGVCPQHNIPAANLTQVFKLAIRELFVNEELSYLLGALRDGSLPKCSIKKEVTLAADLSEEWLNEIAALASRVFSVPPERFKVYRVWTNKSTVPCFRLKIYSREVYELLAQHCPPGNQAYWKTPEAVKASLNAKLAYLAGFYDAEGGCRNAESFLSGKTKTFQCWCSIRCKHNASPNEPLLFVKNLLQELNITSSIYDSDELVMTGIRNIREFYNTVHLRHPKKKDDLQKMLVYSGAFSADA